MVPPSGRYIGISTGEAERKRIMPKSKSKQISVFLKDAVGSRSEAPVQILLVRKNLFTYNIRDKSVQAL